MFWMYCAAFTSPFIALFIRFTAIASCFVITWPSYPFSVEPSFSTTCSSNWLSK